jgi:hypothetical protein
MRPTSTVRMLAVRSAIARQEIPEEAQKLLDLYNDPDVTPEQKKIAKTQLDEMIRNYEDRVGTNRRLRGEQPQ